MKKQIILYLKKRLADIKRRQPIEIDGETLRNIIKEELQYYILDFIYNHPKYREWTMYGGSALRICHGLNRMSVDLDFEIDKECTKKLLINLKEELVRHFEKKYELNEDLLRIKIINDRGLLLKFIIGDQLDLPQHSKQVQIRIDLNYFVVPKIVREKMPVRHGIFSFVIKKYNMSALMASKISALLLRGQRIVGKNIYQEKGRDVYDLLWYMDNGAIPDLDYLKARKVNISNLNDVFRRIDKQLEKVTDSNLKEDLSPLFLEKEYIKDWIQNWRLSYRQLLRSYTCTVDQLDTVTIHQNSRTLNYSFIFRYDTPKQGLATITYDLSRYWLVDKEGEIKTKMNDSLSSKIELGGTVKRLNNQKTTERIKQYVAMLHSKNKDYLKKTNNVILGENIHTKLIRIGNKGLNHETEIVATAPELLTCDLEDLLR